MKRRKRYRFKKKVLLQSGQSLIEYTLILVFIFVVCVAVLRGIGPAVNNRLQPVNSNLQ